MKADRFTTPLNRVLILTIMLLSTASLQAQPVNDLCLSATHIPNVDNYCSDAGQFTNVGATGAGQFITPCLVPLINEVWLTVIPQAPAMLIQVNGNVNNLGTMQGPGIFLFEGTCNALNNVACNISPAGTNVTELTATDLVIGAVYYIAVVSAVPGTFQICVDGFIPPPEPAGDCGPGVVLCDKSSFYIENLLGTGDPNQNEVFGTCVPEETASVWYKWTCDQSGTLTFTLTPNDYIPGFVSADLDFVVYELPGGLDDCANKLVMRCEAAGANTLNGVVLPLSEWAACNGPTGLRDGETDFTEVGGCMGGNNNFAAPLNMVAGKSYALIVNNYSQTGQGFSIDFGGTGTFLGPDPDFEIEAVDAFECDKTIIFTNLSLTPTDSIISYSWNFGAGATPIFMSGNGPHSVVYASFGNKRAALTVESERGCIVTKIIDLYVEPCCADTSTLEAGALAEDLVCRDIPTGIITGLGSAGAPPYTFSLDGMNYSPSTVFPSLGAGSYLVYIQDSKGCRDSTLIDIMNAPPFTVDAGDTIFVDLGEPAQLNAVPSPPIFDNVIWTPSDGLIFSGNDLTPTAFAPGTTWYEVEVINDAGCSATDSVLVLVNIVRPVYIPNVFSPNGDNINDFFFIQGSTAASGLEFLRIFDRWGAVIYEVYDIPLNDPQRGWDGTFKGEYVNPGVFTYYANVSFLDNQTLPYSGTITVLR